jgi:hypothetical protein
MSDVAPDRTVEVVRGRLSDERAEQLLRFWAGHGALTEAEGRRRLPEVVALLLDPTEEIVGVNSVYRANVALIGGRLFWVYRSFLAPEESENAAAMIAVAFGALEAEFDPGGDGPIGLCVLIADTSEMRRRPEAEWPDPRTLYAGHLEDGRQMRIGYFKGAKIGGGVGPVVTGGHAPVLDRESSHTWRLKGGHRIELFADQDAIDDQALIDLWVSEGVLDAEEAQRRVGEVLLVAVDVAGEPAGVSSAYLQHNHQLGMDLWYYRAFAAARHQRSDIAVSLALIGRDHLSERFTSGEDVRAAGIVYEVENEGLKQYFNAALWLPTDFTFIGENERGDHVRVHYFPGALAPAGRSA